jgi:hypothetical protein
MLTAAPEPPTPSLTAQLYRFFFYRWLFLDATGGDLFARAAALAHNRIQGRWLPLYMLRWTLTGGVLMLFEATSEQLTGSSPLTAAFAICLVLVALYLLVTGVCWAILCWPRTQRA